MISSEAKTVIWDLDGTLIDSFGVLYEVLLNILPSHNKDVPSRKVLADNFHGSLDDAISNVLGGGVEPEELKAIVRDFLDVQNRYYEVIDHHIFPDALRLAKRFSDANSHQIVVTNRQHEGRLNASPRNIIGNSMLAGLINRVICGDDSEHRKPKRQVVGSLIEEGVIIPGQTLVIGDQFVDAEFARNLGGHAILVNRNGDRIPHLARLGEKYDDFVTIVKSLDDI